MTRATPALLVLLGLALAGGVAYLATVGDDGRGGGATTRPAASPTVPRPGDAAPIEPAPSLDGAPASSRPRERDPERVAAPAPRSFDPPPTFQTLRGSVVSDQRAIGGAHVVLFEDETPVREVRAEADGSFELRVPVVLASPKLRIVARGFATSVRELPSLRPGEHRLLGNLLVEPSQLVVGSVTSPNGAPAKGAEVLVQSAKTGRGRNHAVLRGTSGADGRFRVTDVMPGPLWVTARLDGFGEARVQAEEGEEVALVLDTDSLWTAVVTDPRGVPVEGARVELTTTGGAPPRRETTDAAGRVTFSGLGPTSRPRVTIAHAEHWPTTLQEVRPGEELEVPLRALPGIVGTVTRADREALVPGTQVRATPAGVRATSDGAGVDVDLATGRYRVGGITPGRWIVEALAPGFAPSRSEPFTVPPEGDTEAPLVLLRRGGVVEFRVASGDGGVRDARVELFSSAPDRRLLLEPDTPGAARAEREGGTDGEGRVVLRELPPGTWWAIVRAPGRVARVHGPFVARDDERVDAGGVTLDDAGRIEGAVRNAEGAPLVGTVVAVVEGQELRRPTDGEGRFALEDLPPGTWTLTVHARAGLSSQPRSVVVRGGETTAQEFEL